jgi:hypothetical protein
LLVVVWEVEPVFHSPSHLYRAVPPEVTDPHLLLLLEELLELRLWTTVLASAAVV